MSKLETKTKSTKDLELTDVTGHLRRNQYFYSRNRSWRVSSNGLQITAPAYSNMHGRVSTVTRHQTLSMDELEPCFSTHISDKKKK